MNPKHLSTVGLAVAILAMVSLVFQESLLAAGVIAIAVQVLAAFLMLWARITFGRRSFHATADPTEGGLMTSGPYHYLRHPIYAAILYFLWAGVLTHLSLFNVSLGLLATSGLIVRIATEERLVTERYPEYLAYASRTKRVIPFIL